MSSEPERAEPEQAQNNADEEETTAQCEDSKMRGKSKKAKPPHPVVELLGDVLVNAEGKTISPKCLLHNDGVIGLYFGAHWCPPCRILTPEMVHLYEEVKKAGHQIEMVFISFDHNLESFDTYLSKMPWWAVEYDKEEKREEIAFNFAIRGIPVLLFLDGKSLEVITMKGKDILLNDPEGQLFPWRNLPDSFSCATPTTSSQSDADKDSQLEVVADGMADEADEHDASNTEGIAGEPQDNIVMAEDQQPGVSQETVEEVNDDDQDGEKTSGKKSSPDHLPQDQQEKSK